MGADVEPENRTVSVWEIQALLQENSEQLWTGLNWLSTGSSGGFRKRLAKTCCMGCSRDLTDGGQRQLSVTERTGRAHL